ncbi:PQQ-binding-like beta-propeller repeat protein [Candidatus Solirubrobacter pratensis]|uniref:PQQ-binding-like beta-propeller repeat protein n=1 Tax=Candidatus Solirubrobacter pratensis TaxID=1298857 RepID=UPI000409E59A|nr:PQQ-binding-like beta-propeller repeat protein [Candidatus Solirubrobacter pratensis]
MSRFRRWQLVAGACALLAVLLAAGAAAFLLTRPGDISNPGVEFHAQTQTPTPTPSPSPAPHKRAGDPADDFVWPVYGYTEGRTRYLAGPSLRPPYARLWSVHARSLLEFPPAIGGRTLYLLDNDGIVWAIGKRHGAVHWKRRVGVLAASTPAYGGGRLYVTVLSRAPGRPGRVLAMRASDGKILWSRSLPSRTESPPLLDSGRIYFGSEDGTVYALRAGDGGVRWTFKADGSVKGGLALSDGKLYFGDYAGKMYAIRRADGSLVWRTGTSGAAFGLSSGQFYSTPAVAFGRVYIGNTDHYVYSFGADHGKLAWRRGTGGYVYSSPAVADVPGGRPAVYLGSYDGRFYALDAKSGRTLWTYHDGGTISGGTTIVGDIVYFSNNRLKTTTGLGARTGRRVFKFNHGAFNPVVSDGERIYLTGSSSLYALRPKASPTRR